MSTSLKKIVVLSAGGTGGHLFPAQALAGALAGRGRDIVVMTDTRFSNYATAFPRARIETVPSSPLNSLAAPFKIAAGVAIALAKLLKLKPAAVIGFGGYPSVPVMLAASLARLPTAIIEQNAVMGRANRLVMNRVKVVAAAFPIARFAPADRSKIVLTGNPLRPEVEALWGSPYQAPKADGPLRLLVFGGSQGARAMSEIVPAALTRLPHDIKKHLSVVQQCRPEDIETVRQVYANAEIRAELQSFFSDLPRRMAESHLVIARSGAGTVAELMAIGRPAILVPLPGALDDNQTPNADILAKAGAGWRIAQAGLSPDSLAQLLLRIFA
ncbi:MAG TPA: undecaprenyldiphospho-muramoylpentapeptide beta-N-acetylglucosaminyltransferase, partial [Rhizomicrobium sp.]|nr:undecaprenyldiphospho-muramoylpentapeptide beta-N-acetylglucosaminyltransferase [Rhizomicrobium sp.]